MTTTTTTEAVEATLERYGRMTAGALGEFLDRLRPSAPGLAELVADYPSRGGKAIRPALVMATCQAFGGSPRDAIGPAVSIEMLHNAFLIHDDVEDASELRRGQSTLHRLHGIPLAVNAGDALAMLAMQPLRDDGVLGSRLQHRVVTEYLAMAQRTVEGQARELEWRRDNVLDRTPEDYLELIGAKTCWYTTIYPLRVGALIGSRGAADLGSLSRFGFYLGAAFQIRDDLLDLVGVTADTGKEPLGDLREGKRTLMLLHLVRHASPEDRRWVVDTLGAESRSATEVAELAALMERYGSIDFATEYGQGIADAARRSFSDAFGNVPPSPHRQFLRDMVDYMLDRRG